MRNIVLILLLSFSSMTFACRVADTSTSDRVSEASEIHFGYVTGIYWDSFESQQLKNGLFIDNEFLIGSDLKTYRILVKESFKGKSAKIKEVKIDWCGGGGAELGSRVVVYTSKFGNHIESLTEDLYKSIKSARRVD